MTNRPSVIQALTGAVLCAALLSGSLLVHSVLASDSVAPVSPFATRVAERLQRRLVQQGRSSPSVNVLTKAVIARQQLLGRSVSATLVSTTGATSVWNVSPAANPLWLAYRITPISAETVVDSAAIDWSVQNWVVPGTYPPVDMDIQEVRQDGPVLRANTSGAAKDGVVLEPGAAEKIAKVLKDPSAGLTLALQRSSAVIRNHTAYDLNNLSVLAVGRSNFKGSDNGRIANVKKALTKHVHNVVVPADAAFSFNDTIKGSGGWELAKIIVGGTLELGPGGGICQASTTVFRGMLAAGLPVLKHRSHSMYVVYYEKYGVGLDATIFPGSQDLQFMNDTGHPLLIQTVIDGWEAEVRVLGVNDGRKVTLNGPYFSTTAPDHIRVSGRPMRANEIVWQRQVDYADGRIVNNDVLAQYKSLPRSVVTKYLPEVVHAAGF